MLQKYGFRILQMGVFIYIVCQLVCAEFIV
jgi:hypothetical protein